MALRRRALLGAAVAGPILPARTGAAGGGDPLPSWNEGAAKHAILAFVRGVGGEGSVDYIPPPERIACFDNDGTLWIEQPMYVQLEFALDRVRTLAPQHPEWRVTQPFKAILAGDIAGFVDAGEKGAVELIMATHAGMTTAEFTEIVADWLAKARHPRFHRPYTELVYQPMLELLRFLRSNGFKTFVVTGGGIEFVRVFSERAYGIPPEQVVGSSIRTRFELQNGKPVLIRLPEVEFVDDGPGKPVGINRFIGRRPIFAAGNSDGDLEMLQWTTAAPGERFGMLIHHTDARREYAYGRQSGAGRLDKALAAAPQEGWTVVDMRTDWRRVFSFQ